MAEPMTDDDVVFADQKFSLFYPDKDGNEVRDTGLNGSPTEHSVGGAPFVRVKEIKRLLLAKPRLAHLRAEDLKIIPSGKVTSEQEALRATMLAGTGQAAQGE